MRRKALQTVFARRECGTARPGGEDGCGGRVRVRLMAIALEVLSEGPLPVQPSRRLRCRKLADRLEA